MSWINSLFNRNRTETIEVELLDETDKSIKIKYGIHTTFLPKKIITFDRVNTDRIIKVRLPLWLYRKKFN
jgi:hypothetical protein